MIQFLQKNISSINDFISKLDEDEKYEGIKKYSKGSYHPKDFNYHDRNSCGTQGNIIDKSNKIEDGLRKNNIYCNEDDYEEYINRNIDDVGIHKIISSRKKACNCEYQRKLKLNYYKKNEPEKYDKQHEQANKTVRKIFNQSIKLEKS